MKVCWYGSYDGEYSRNQILLAGLRANGVEVVECNVTSTGLRRYVDLVRSLQMQKNNYDVLYCAFPAWYTVPIAYFFQKQPIVADAFYPSYDAFVNDRKKVSRWSLGAVKFWWLDRMTARKPQHLVVDTQAHTTYWKRLAPKQNFSVLPVGAATDIYKPVESSASNKTTVTFYGSYIPLQGVDKLVAAAQLLADESDLTIRFIGPKKMLHDISTGPLKTQANVELLPWQDQVALNLQINEADIILGIFGDTAKAKRVVPNKVWQGLAAKKPVLTMDTPALRELFTDSEVCLIKNTPEAIAEEIKALAQDRIRRETVATAGYRRFLEVGTPEVLGRQLTDVLQLVALSRSSNRK